MDKKKKLPERTYRHINPFPNNPWFLHVYSTSLLKTQWEKIMSNFSFSHSVFNPFGGLPVISIIFEIVVCKLFQSGRVQNLSFGKGLNGGALSLVGKNKMWRKRKGPIFSAMFLVLPN